MAVKVLLVDSVHACFNHLMEAEGIEVVDGTSWTKEEIIKTSADFAGLVIRSRFQIDEAFLVSCPTLKVIGRAGAGMENIDVDRASQLGIACINTPEGNRDAVAEHALGMLLLLTNKLRTADAEVRKGIWRREENRGTELMQKTIGILGFGNMGSAFAQRLQGFGVRILALDPYITIDKERYPYVEQCDADYFYDSCDVVSLHLPLTEVTYHLADSAWFARFRKPIWLINTARGKNVDTEALANALQQGKVLGAGLDVLEAESVSFEQVESGNRSSSMDFLLQSDNVILTPHVAGWSYESHVKISEFLFQKMLPYLR
jgi:D-3-phosphoglycerate dehydrogenase